MVAIEEAGTFAIKTPCSKDIECDSIAKIESIDHEQKPLNSPQPDLSSDGSDSDNSSDNDRDQYHHPDLLSLNSPSPSNEREDSLSISMHQIGIECHSSDSSDCSSSYRSGGSNATYTSFKIHHSEHSDIDSMDFPMEKDLDLYWWLSIRRMKLQSLCRWQHRFQSMSLSLSVTSFLLYIAFMVQFSDHFMDSLHSNSNQYILWFTLLINSGLLSTILMLLDYYGSALRMSYDGVIYPVFIMVLYGMMTLALSLNEIDIDPDREEQSEALDDILTAPMGRVHVTICYDWMGHPINALIHFASMLSIGILLHFLFVISKNNIIAALWRRQNTAGCTVYGPFGIAEDLRDSVIHSTERRGSSSFGNESGYIDANTVDMNTVMESNLVLEMSTTISGISTQLTSIVDVQYDPTPKMREAGSQRLYAAGKEQQILVEDDEESVDDE